MYSPFDAYYQTISMERVLRNAKLFKSSKLLGVEIYQEISDLVSWNAQHIF